MARKGNSGQTWGSGLPNVIRPVRGKQVKRQVRAAVRREFRPVAKGIRRELKQSRANQRQTNKLYRGYNQRTRALSADTQAAYDQAIAANQSRLDANASRDSAFRDALKAQNEASAALRGAPVQNSAVEASRQGSAQQALNTVGLASVMQAQKADAIRAGNENLRISAGDRRQQILKELGRRNEIRADLRELKRKRGEFKTKALEDLRQRERDFFIQNRAFAGDQSEIAKDLDYNQAIRDVAAMGLAGDRARARSNRDVARQQGRNQRREANAKSRRGVRRGLDILGAEAGDSIDWRFTQRHRRELVQGLVRRHSLSSADARAAVARQIKRQKREEQRLRNSRPATGNTSLPGIRNP